TRAARCRSGPRRCRAALGPFGGCPRSAPPIARVKWDGIRQTSRSRFTLLDHLNQITERLWMNKEHRCATRAASRCLIDNVKAVLFHIVERGTDVRHP